MRRRWVLVAAVALVPGMGWGAQDDLDSYFTRYRIERTYVNGWEDYLEAADRLDDLRRSRTFSRELAGAPNLQRVRSFLQSLPPFLELLKLGTAKPCFFPRPEALHGSHFHEFDQFKEILELLAYDLEVSFWLNDYMRAETIIGTVLEFVDDCSRVHMLAPPARFYELIVTHGHRLNSVQCERLIERLDRILTKVPAPYEALLITFKSYQWMRSMLERSPDIVSKDYWQMLKLPPDMEHARRVELIFGVSKQVESQYLDAICVMLLPESMWHKKEPPRLDSELECTIAEHIIPSRMLSWSFDYLAAYTTRLRLLRLHFLTLIHKSRHGRAPYELTALKDPKRTFDPLSQAPFQYASYPNGRFELWSPGNSATGPIYLSPRGSDVRLKASYGAQGIAEMQRGTARIGP